jgi:ligand-binding sensor domain-containing protein
MLQTQQGYLWIGTDKGLLRFDGVRFTDFPFATTPGMSQGPTVFTAL